MKQVMNLHDAITRALEEHEVKHDFRFKRWYKFVNQVDDSKATGYAFIGPFVPEGTMEIDLDADAPALILTATTTGSRSYHTMQYNILILGRDGQFTLTDIQTTDAQKGWALRIRDPITALLGELRSAPAAHSLSVTLSPAIVEILDILVQRLPHLTTDEIVAGAVNLYEMHTRRENENGLASLS